MQFIRYWQHCSPRLKLAIRVSNIRQIPLRLYTRTPIKRGQDDHGLSLFSTIFHVFGLSVRFLPTRSKILESPPPLIGFPFPLTRGYQCSILRFLILRASENRRTGKLSPRRWVVRFPNHSPPVRVERTPTCAGLGGWWCGDSDARCKDAMLEHDSKKKKEKPPKLKEDSTPTWGRRIGLQMGISWFISSVPFPHCFIVLLLLLLAGHRM